MAFDLFKLELFSVFCFYYTFAGMRFLDDYLFYVFFSSFFYYFLGSYFLGYYFFGSSFLTSYFFDSYFLIYYFFGYYFLGYYAGINFCDFFISYFLGELAITFFVTYLKLNSPFFRSSFHYFLSATFIFPLYFKSSIFIF